MHALPLFMVLRGRRALVVGGGDAAARKARLLLEADARVCVVAPEMGPALQDVITCGEVEWRARSFLATDVRGMTLVIAATDDEELDREVSQASRADGIPVNVVDRPAMSDFIMPAIIDRDPVTVAVSTAGTAPVLARRVRAAIEVLLPANVGRLARFAERFRGAVKAVYQDETGRRRFWQRFFDGPVAAAVLSGDERWAQERMLAEVNQASADDLEQGVVHIVGAGPGSSDLLTLRALRLLQDADVIVHDRLVGPDVLNMARRDADRIDVGKASGHHPWSQPRINALMVALARQGKTVVRLKGGDPFVFGRGGEERDALVRHGVRCEIVPGVTAALGCAAAAGIPLTHRDLAHAAVLVAGHGRDGEPDVDWAAMAAAKQTLVIYMGAGRAGAIASTLRGHGVDPATPVAVIADGTLPTQRSRIGHLGDLPALVAALRGTGPLLIIVGDVVAMADTAAMESEIQAAAS